MPPERTAAFSGSGREPETGVAPSVPDGERKHAAQPMDTVLAPLLVGLNSRFRVRAGAEPVTTCTQFGAQCLEIVNLPIDTICTEPSDFTERLVAGGPLDDGEPALAETDAGASIDRNTFEVTSAVRASVRNRIGHAIQRLAQVLADTGRKISGDAAHSLGTALRAANPD
jgi:hypothetical protein